MAHCDVRMSDQANVPVHTGINSIRLMDQDRGGSLIGLGVVSNGEIIVATYQRKPRLVQYDSAGEKQWDSDQDISFALDAWKSVPMLSVAGDIVMVDDDRIVRFNRQPQGGYEVMFNEAHEERGAPISPVLTDNQYIVVALVNGIVLTKHVDGGGEIKKLDLKLGTDTIRNTPCVHQNHVFIPTGEGLIKVNIADDGEPIEDWTQPVNATGGDSPLYSNGYVYYSAKEKTIEKFKILKVDASNGIVVARSDPIAVQPITASIAQSPVDNSLYYFVLPNDFIQHIDEDLNTIDKITKDELGGIPASPMTITSDNHMIVRTGFGRKAGVTAIDLANNHNHQVWRIPYEEEDSGAEGAWGQFAIVNKNVFFTTRNKRLHKLCVGE